MNELSSVENEVREILINCYKNAGVDDYSITQILTNCHCSNNNNECTNPTKIGYCSEHLVSYPIRSNLMIDTHKHFSVTTMREMFIRSNLMIDAHKHFSVAKIREKLEECDKANTSREKALVFIEIFDFLVKYPYVVLTNKKFKNSVIKKLNENIDSHLLDREKMQNYIKLFTYTDNFTYIGTIFYKNVENKFDRSIEYGKLLEQCDKDDSYDNMIEEGNKNIILFDLFVLNDEHSSEKWQMEI
jgi:hypothetical protein